MKLFSDLFRHRSSRALLLSAMFGFCLHGSQLAAHPSNIYLKDAAGNKIKVGAAVPCSPKQTCGVCHDYQLITSAYHFQQGKDQINEDGLSGKPWVLSPGMYGKF